MDSLKKDRIGVQSLVLALCFGPNAVQVTTHSLLTMVKNWSSDEEFESRLTASRVERMLGVMAASPVEENLISPSVRALLSVSRRLRLSVSKFSPLVRENLGIEQK